MGIAKKHFTHCPKPTIPQLNEKATLVKEKRRLWLVREVKTTSKNEKTIYNLRKWKLMVMNENWETKKLIRKGKSWGQWLGGNLKLMRSNFFQQKRNKYRSSVGNGCIGQSLGGYARAINSLRRKLMFADVYKSVWQDQVLVDLSAWHQPMPVISKDCYSMWQIKSSVKERWLMLIHRDLQKTEHDKLRFIFFLKLDVWLIMVV